MELSIVLEIEKDAKLHEYLMHHSYWYRLLNRDQKNFEALKKEYKTFKRNANFDKVNNVVENLELVSNIMKIVE